MAAVSLNAYKGSASLTQNTDNSSPISLPSLTDLTGGQIQSAVGNDGSNIGGFVGNNAGGTINVLDGGAIGRAFDFADTGIAGIFDLTAAMLDQNRLNTSDFYNEVQQSSKDALNYIAEQTNSEASQRQFLIKVLGGAAVLGVLFFGFKFKWGK